MFIPVKTMVSIGVTAVCGAASAIVSQIQQKKLIEEIGDKLSKQVIENIQKK